ncbi:hypothetical protein ACLOJK_038986 [Asimina triloba]
MLERILWIDIMPKDAVGYAHYKIGWLGVGEHYFLSNESLAKEIEFEMRHRPYVGHFEEVGSSGGWHMFICIGVEMSSIVCQGFTRPRSPKKTRRFMGRGHWQPKAGSLKVMAIRVEESSEDSLGRFMIPLKQM